MSYKSEFQSNNTDLQRLIDKANALPVAENLDSEISQQDSLIEQIAAALVGKAGGSAAAGVEYEIVNIPKGSTSKTYSHSLSRVTNVFGGMYNPLSAPFLIGTGTRVGDVGLGQVLSVNDNICYRVSTIDADFDSSNPSVEANVEKCQVIYSNNTITFPTSVNCRFEVPVMLILINDPNNSTELL